MERTTPTAKNLDVIIKIKTLEMYVHMLDDTVMYLALNAPSAVKDSSGVHKGKGI